MKTIDLHGLIEYEALMQVDAALLDLDYYEDEIQIITGKGDVIRWVVTDYISDLGYSWEWTNSSQGAIIVYSKQK